MPGLVFVYGTLRRGQRNHYMLRSSPFLGMHVTEPCYTMLDLGSYPAVVRGGHCAISGELYRVTPPTLATLDELEDYPDRYDRAVITTEQGDTSCVGIGCAEKPSQLRRVFDPFEQAVPIIIP
jgi:gamma-glutamylcyclotransferase (GGCT)/AIG2-like uncharacterized protein YtfP